MVPRHRQIVANIAGDTHAETLTVLIGLAEIVMALWIASSILSRMNAIIQIVVIAAMNIIEFIMVPELLLWGRANTIFAFVLILVIYYNEFHLNKKVALQA